MKKVKEVGRNYSSLLDYNDLINLPPLGLGSVTSVGMSVPSAFSITGSPITTSGTLALTGAGTTSQYIRGDGTLATFPTMLSSDSLIKEVYNDSGATMTKGTIIYINGTHGNLPTIAKGLATSDATSAQTFGMVKDDITNNNNGYVVIIGNIIDMDTQYVADGTQLYLSGTTAGTYTTTKPYAPIHLVYVGIVVRSHPTQGIISVKCQNGFEVDEIHNLSAQTPSNNDGIFYNSSNSLWENKTIATALGFTPTTTLRTISTTSPLSGGGDLSANRTLSISQSNTTTNGYLSSTDWNIFNNKQATITLTTTGSSGASTFVTNTLNIPTYTLAGLGGITLTSLSSTATGLTYTNTTGVFSLTSGYAIPTTASQTTWDSAYTNRITSLTTTGSSGASTLISNVLNVPTYTLAGLGGFANPMTTLGDSIYGGASGAVTRLAGNTTTAKQYLSQTGTGTISAAPIWSTIAGADITGAALTKVDDTNVTITLGGTPTTALLRATSITLGWTGTLADARIASASTWNAKQSAITLTTTGSSGSSTFVTNTLNIPTYTLAGLGGITLTSLSSTATGLTYTNTTGVFSLTSGYAIPTTASQTTWDSAYTNRITSLTTTGSSGSATLVSNVLNIPTYTLAGLGGLSNPMTSLGDSIYGGASGAVTRLAGNITTAKQYLSQTGTGTISAAPIWATIAGADITGAALTKVDDTNVTITLGGTPTTALLRAASITLGWTGTLADARITSAATWNAKESALTFTAPLSRSTNTISMAAANTSVDGYLTTTDWDTFNNKQATITLTTTGSSGSSTFVTNTLNIPTYTLAGLGGVSSNIYTADGTLSGARIVTQGANLLTFNASKTSGNSLTISSTQTAVNTTDTGDGSLFVNYILTATTAAVAQLVSRAFSFTATNNLTGAGSSITSLRVIDVQGRTNATTTTTNLDLIYVLGGATASGSVTNSRGVYVRNLQGTSQAGLVIDDLSGASTNSTGLVLNASAGAIPTGDYGVYQYGATLVNQYEGYLSASKMAVGGTTFATYTLEVTGTGYFSSSLSVAGSFSTTSNVNNFGISNTTATGGVINVLSPANVYNTAYDSSIYIGGRRTDINDANETTGYRIQVTNTGAANSIFNIQKAFSATPANALPASYTTLVSMDSNGIFSGLSSTQFSATTGLIYLTGISSEPAAPSSGVGIIYGKYIAGKFFAKTKGLLNSDSPLQSSLWQNNIVRWTQNNTTNGLWIGSVGGGIGTYTNQNPNATTNVYTASKRSRYANVVTTANQVLGQRTTEQIFAMGSVAGQGGFFFYARFGFDVWTNGGRLFAGMATGDGVISVNSSTFANCCGFDVDTTDNGLIYFLTRSATTATRTSTTLTIVTNKAYDVFMFCPPNGTTIYYRIVDITTGTEASGSHTTNLPVNTTLFQASVLASNAALTPVNSIHLGVSNIYVESDY